MNTRQTALAVTTALGLFSSLSIVQAADISAPSGGAEPSQDIVAASIVSDQRWVSFALQTAGTAGRIKPQPTGQLPGAGVEAYVWPTSLDPATVGFAAGSGILAMVVTAHPDFDDTPLFDENGDQDRDNDGGGWHSHWVVLGPDDACGAQGTLKVLDMAGDGSAAAPSTWPGLPLMLDSPGYSPRVKGRTVTVRVPFDDLAKIKGTKFDAVTAALNVNGEGKAPLLCVTKVHDIASGDLSLPGMVE